MHSFFFTIYILHEPFEVTLQILQVLWATLEYFLGVFFKLSRLQPRIAVFICHCNVMLHYWFFLCTFLLFR